jgi:hypothetical protein
MNVSAAGAGRVWLEPFKQNCGRKKAQKTQK